MAMLDMSRIVDSMIRRESPEGQQETAVVTAAFSTKVSSVAEAGVKLYIDTDVACTKAVAASGMTLESAAFAVDCAKQLMVAKTDYAVAYFSP